MSQLFCNHCKQLLEYHSEKELIDCTLEICRGGCRWGLEKFLFPPRRNDLFSKDTCN